MFKKSSTRVIISLLVLLSVRSLLIQSLDILNVSMTDYIEASENEIIIDDGFEGLKVIENLKSDDDSLEMLVSSDGEPYSIFIRQFMFRHEIYVDGQLFSQNHRDDDRAFKRNFAYDIIDVDNGTNIRISGKHLDRVEFFIGKKNTVDNANEWRLIAYIIKFIGLILLLILFAVMYFYNRSERYFLILMIITITSIIKSVSLGELPSISMLMGIDIDKIYIIDRLTTMINIILPIIIIIDAFEIKLPRRIKSFILILIPIFSYFLWVDFDRFEGIVYFVLYIVSLGFILHGVAYRKRYYQLIVLNATIYFSFGVYKINVIRGMYRTGLMHFYTNTAYLGAIIYLIVFAIFFFERYRRKIEESVSMKKEFERVQLLRGISHDLRLPLSVIKVSSQMMESGKLDDEEIKQFSRDITQEVDILKDMTDNINMYLKLGHKTNKSFKTSVRTVFERIEKYFKRINSDGKYLFNVTYDEVDMQVDIEELELYRLMYNLVDNAFKYCQHNDVISISYRVKNKLEIIVEDTGIGMESDKIDKVFSPFYRLDESRNDEGLGLGLSVVKAIVDKSGGEIVITSQNGIGTLVHILI